MTQHHAGGVDVRTFRLGLDVTGQDCLCLVSGAQRLCM